MRTARRVEFGACFIAALILFIGCKPSAEQQRTAQLEQFRKQMEQIDASITVGMPYPDLVAKIGQPVASNTNDGWIAHQYLYEPQVFFHDVITNGFSVFVSNDVVFRKSPIAGHRR